MGKRQAFVGRLDRQRAAVAADIVLTWHHVLRDGSSERVSATQLGLPCLPLGAGLHPTPNGPPAHMPLNSGCAVYFAKSVGIRGTCAAHWWHMPHASCQ